MYHNSVRQWVKGFKKILIYGIDILILFKNIFFTHFLCIILLKPFSVNISLLIIFYLE